MPITKLKTVEELRVTAVSEKNYRSLKEAERDIEAISQQVFEELEVLKKFQRSLEQAGKSAFVIESPTLNKSPKPKRGNALKVYKAVEKNFQVIQSLHDAKQALELLEAKIKAASRDMGSDSSKALKSLVSVRKQIYKGLDETFDFLSNEAQKSAPEEFTEFTQKLETLVSRAMAYQDSVSNTYVFTNEDSLCYAHYIQLSALIDDNGSEVPTMLVVASVKVTEDGAEYYLDVLNEFEPPSKKLFVQPIQILKMATVAVRLSDLLRVNQFANSIKRVPIRLLLQPSTITPELFLYQTSIAKVEIDESENQINFVLKPTVKDKELVDKIVQQLYVDTKAMLVATRARLRVAITEKRVQRGKAFVISFFLVRSENAPAAAADDLDFLKDRFALPDQAIQEILKTINKN